jgi:hypothetical protein
MCNAGRRRRRDADDDGSRTDVVEKDDDDDDGDDDVGAPRPTKTPPRPADGWNALVANAKTTKRTNVRRTRML